MKMKIQIVFLNGHGFYLEFIVFFSELQSRYGMLLVSMIATPFRNDWKLMMVIKQLNEAVKRAFHTKHVLRLKSLSLNTFLPLVFL